jgi:iron(III) transport system substrate-binding protein
MFRWLVPLFLTLSPARAEVVLFPASPETARMTIYSTLDAPLARPLIDAFQGQNPGVTVVYDELLAGEIYDRVLSEPEGTADFVFSSAMDLTVKLANDGQALAVDVPLEGDWPRWANWRDMAFALTFEPAVIVYHRPSFPDGPPDTRAALMGWLKDAPQGKIGTYDIARSAVGYLFFSRDQEHFADVWPLVEAMGKAGVRVFPTSQDVIDRVDRGELWLGYNILGSYATDQATRRPDLGIVLPRDYVVVASRVGLVPKAARSPDLGQAMLAFLMGREGQTLLAEKLRLPAVSLEVSGKDSAGAMARELGARLRPVPVSPGLLAYLDPANRARVLARWRAAVE